MSKYIEIIENNNTVRKEIFFRDECLIEKLKGKTKDEYYITFNKTINSNLGIKSIKKQFRTMKELGDELIDIRRLTNNITTALRLKKKEYELTFKNYPLLYRLLDCSCSDFFFDWYLYLNNDVKLLGNDYYSTFQYKYIYDYINNAEFDSHIPMNYKLWVLRQVLYNIDNSKIDLSNISDLNKQEIIEEVYDMAYDFSSQKTKIKKK